jgi:hypothetical protein
MLPYKSIKPQSQSGQILRTLASRAELRQEIIIRETDYQYEPRSNQHQIDSDILPFHRKNIDGMSGEKLAQSQK